MSERILVFPASFLDRLPAIDGISLEPEPYGQFIFNTPGVGFRERSDELESDAEWKQVIPYMLVQFEDTFLVYQRTKSGAEGRLHSKYSIGIGGHIKDSDGVGPVDAYMNGMRRELHEEVELDTDPDPTTVKGCIYYPHTDVGRVHFGFVYILNASSPKAIPRDPAVGIPSFMAVPFILSMKDKFEDWSRLCIESFLER